MSFVEKSVETLKLFNTVESNKLPTSLDKLIKSLSFNFWRRYILFITSSVILFISFLLLSGILSKAFKSSVG